MHPHTRWFIYIVLLIFVLLMGYLLHVKLNTPSPYTVVSAPVVPHNRDFVEKKIQAKESYAIFDIVYPQFPHADAAFNKKIEDIVLNAKTEFAQNAEDNWKAFRETSFEMGDPGEFPSDPYPMYVKWEQAQVNDRYISVIMRISGFNGGAHGYENLYTFNYDVAAQKELTLADLFPNDPNYLKTVSDFSRAKLLAHLIDVEELDVMSEEEQQTYIEESVQPMLEAGTEPTIENFSVFTFTDTEITIYFSQYQVAPYAAGEQKVIIPRQ